MGDKKDKAKAARAASYGLITDEELDRVRSRIGKWRPGKPVWRDATRDIFRAFTRGVGCRDRLYQDEEYAAKTQWGGLIAFPTHYYTYVRGRGLYGGGFPGVAGSRAGDSWFFYQPIRIGDKITSKLTLWDVQLKPSKHAGKAVDQLYRAVYVNERDEMVAEQYWLSKRWERQKTYESGTDKKKRRYADWKRWQYTEEELQKIREDYEKEEIRGATPRYWEDVNIGDNLPPIVKGPYTAREIVAFYMGAGAPLVMASGVLFEFFREFPGANVPDAETNTPDVPERVHFESQLAQRFGAPDMYDITHQRLSWGANFVTNWMGDDAFLRECSCIARRFFPYGDTLWINGEVTEKYQTDDENLVKIQFTCDTQRKERNGWGHALVSLPSRERGSVKLSQAPPAPVDWTPPPEKLKDIFRGDRYEEEKEVDGHDRSS